MPAWFLFLSCIALIRTVVPFATDAAEQSESDCPLPPMEAQYNPPLRTALASHPRAGSTWFRFLVEHASGLPCGCEKHGWMNVLMHTGEDLQDSKMTNKNGVIVKTHSGCYGCWKGADLSERWTVKQNSSYSEKDVWTKYARADALLEQGACLLGINVDLDTMLQQLIEPRAEGKGKGRGNMPPDEETRTDKEAVETLPCNYTYDRAIILQRDPLDAIRSNYHYRTNVLGMGKGRSWNAGDYYFPKERASAFVRLFNLWRRFGEVQPTLLVRYEDLKARTQEEMRRVMAFLEIEATDERIRCAVESSTMENLKQSTLTKGSLSAKSFFGSRGATEANEDLSYPAELLEELREMGLLEVRWLLGYRERDDVPGLEKYLTEEAVKPTGLKREL